MSGWRSPLLYLGILVILVAAVALVVPPFIDWTHYRADIEGYGRRFTGRAVRIDGIIDVRLFPWPVLIMQDVHIANPPGAQTSDLLLAGRIEARLALAPLISGHVQIEQIKVDKPVFGLERLAAGGATWELTPKLEVTDFVSAEHIGVAGITISRATVLVGDGRRGGLAQIDDVNAQLSAPALDGPWRFAGIGSYRGKPIEVNVTTGKYHKGQPLTVGARVAPPKGNGIVYSFDGEVGGARADTISGNLKLTPAQAVSGRGDKETGLKPLVFNTAIKVRDDTVILDKIELYPARALDAANLLTGKAVVRLGSTIAVDADLTAAKVDVDAVTGEHGRELLYSPSSLDIVAAAQKLMPANLTAKIKLDIKNLVVAGDLLDGASLDATVSRQRLSIRRLQVQLPGQTRVGFAGSFVNGDNGPQLIGDVDVDLLAIRDLVTWVAPATARDIAKVWSGQHGKLTLKAKADISASALRLNDITAKLDGSNLGGSVQLAGGSTPSIVVRLDADRLDVDRYAPDGLTLASSESNPFLAGVDMVASSMGLGEFHLTGSVGRLKLNGVEAEDVAVDMSANENGIEFRTVDVGNVAGARLDMTGLLHFPNEAVAGSINAKVNASDPNGLFRLLGLVGHSERTSIYDRLAALKPLNIEVIGEATAEGDNTTASLKANGVFGKTNLAINANFDGNASDWQEGSVHVSAIADDPSSAAVLGLLGFSTRGGQDAAARLNLTSTGTYARGLATTIDATAYGANTQFVGTLAKGANGPRLSGRLAVLAERAALFYQALGVPAGELSPMAQVLSGEGGLNAEDGKVALNDLNGTIAGISYSGRADADLSGDRPQVKVRLDLGRLSGPWLLDALALPHDGKTHDFATRFADTFDLPASIDAKLRIQTVELLPGLVLKQASLDMTASDNKVDMKLNGSSNGGKQLSLALVVEPGEAGASMSGNIAGRLPLGAIFRRADGAGVISGDSDIALSFSGEGRSPQGLATAAIAKGTYKLADGVLDKLSPGAFALEFAKAKVPEDIDKAIRDALTSGNMAFTGGEGTLGLDKGVLTASPLALAAADAQGQLRMLFEPAEGKVDIEVDLKLAQPEGVPSFQIAYAGPADALVRSSDTQALKNYLTVKVLNESIKQLEELQRRENQMKQEELQFQREQAAKEELRRELSRKLDQLKAWQRSQSSNDGADLQTVPALPKDPVDTVLVPTPKTKPPVPADFTPQLAAQPLVVPAPSPPDITGSVPQSLFNVQGAPIFPRPQLRTGRFPATDR